MAAFVALYRGINVGGRRPVKMEALCALHQRLGHHQVRHYIQSGNVIFSARGKAGGIAPKLAAAFSDTFGFDAHVLVVDAQRWISMVRNNPYEKAAAASPKTVHVGICQREPSTSALQALLVKTKGNEAFQIIDGVLYLHAPDGFGTSKFAVGMEKAAGVPMTARNWLTVQAVGAMVAKPEQ